MPPSLKLKAFERHRACLSDAGSQPRASHCRCPPPPTPPPAPQANMRAAAHSFPAAWSAHPRSAEEVAMVLVRAGRVQDASYVLMRVQDAHLAQVHRVSE